MDNYRSWANLASNVQTLPANWKALSVIFCLLAFTSLLTETGAELTIAYLRMGASNEDAG
ncbi:MAG: hypothetical protein WED00_04050 [Aquisalimonadaceae bacterium]